jgi:hypothetical protein
MNTFTACSDILVMLIELSNSFITVFPLRSFPLLGSTMTYLIAATNGDVHKNIICGLLVVQSHIPLRSHSISDPTSLFPIYCSLMHLKLSNTLVHGNNARNLSG